MYDDEEWVMSVSEPQTPYQRYQQQCRAFNERLLGVLRRDLAERQADFDADRHDLELRRNHAAKAFLVQRQIEEVEGKLEQPQSTRPPIIDATLPRQQTRTRFRRRQRAIS